MQGTGGPSRLEYTDEEGIHVDERSITCLRKRDYA